MAGPDTVFLTSINGVEPDVPFLVTAGSVEVTPTGLSQVTLADALALVTPGQAGGLPTTAGAAGTLWNNGGVVCERATVTPTINAIGFNSTTVTPSTNFSVTIPSNISYYVMIPSGTIATGTLTTPANPVSGQLLRVVTTQAITTFSFLAHSGQIVFVGSAPTTLTANTSFGYVFIGNTWYREY